MKLGKVCILLDIDDYDHVFKPGWTMLQAAGSNGLVMDVSKRDSNIILWRKPRGPARKDNQLFKVTSPVS